MRKFMLMSLTNHEANCCSIQFLLKSLKLLLSFMVFSVTSDENVFAVSNNTCGEVLVGQSGFIRFTGAALYRTPYFPTACVWTIRANHRRSVMIKTSYSTISSLSSPANTYAYAVEILKGDSLKFNATNFQTKITKLQRNEQQTFTGPLIFIIYELSSSSNHLELHFQGLGKLAEKDVRFSHEHSSEASGNLQSDLMKNWKGLDLPSNASNYSLDFSSIVLSNFSTKVYLEASFINSSCQDTDSSFLVIYDILNRIHTSVVNCCEKSCEGGNGLLSYGDPYFIIILKKSGVPFHFNLSWEAEPRYPSSSGLERWSSYSYKCGGVIGGSSGTIYYKPRLSYKNEERCLWVIKQQPGPRSFLKIEVISNGVRDSSDFLYAMELTHANGTARADAPKITHLAGYNSYYVHSREVYIVFYTDSSGIGQGFALNWKSVGELKKTGGDVLTNFNIFRNDSGHGTSLQSRPPRIKSLYQVFIIAPMTMSSRSYGLQIQIKQTQPTAINNCLHEDATIYKAYNGLFRKREIYGNCLNQTENEVVQFRNINGMVLIVLNDTSQADSPPVAVEFDWKEMFGDGDSNYITVEDNLCGGVIIGDKGVLKYKFDTQYFDDERCVWLLSAPNRTSITLDLLKSGLEVCCDKIMVNTIDPDKGKLRNDTQILDHENPTKTFMGSVLAIVFRSDTSTRGTGFALQFHGRGNSSEPPEYRYQLRHYNEPFGMVEYPSSSEWEEPQAGLKEILVIASSVGVDIDSNNLTLSTKLNWISGVFKKESDSCTYESITFYTSPSVSGWHPKGSLPREDDMVSCPSEISVPRLDNVCNTAYSAFLAVYRHIPATPEAEVDGEESTGEQARSSIGFTFEKSATCGGVFTGSSGEISYKEDGIYENNERCLWIIHSPEAKKIGLKMEKSGFEQCCDLVYIYTISKDGNPVRTFNFTQGNVTSAVVDGPVAIVAFSSDHSVNGRGFRLTYTTAVRATEPFPYRYHVEHAHGPARFAFEMGANDLAIAAFSREPPSSHSRLSSILPLFPSTTQINVTSMRTQIAQNCVSDMLTFYKVLGKQDGLVPVKSFSALDVLKGDSRTRVRTETSRNGTCDPLKNNQFRPCINGISDCYDVPDDNTLNLNGTSFVAVYRSVNVSSNDLQYRGFAMVSDYMGMGASVPLPPWVAELDSVELESLISGNGSGSGNDNGSGALWMA